MLIGNRTSRVTQNRVIVLVGDNPLSSKKRGKKPNQIPSSGNLPSGDASFLPFFVCPPFYSQSDLIYLFVYSKVILCSASLLRISIGVCKRFKNVYLFDQLKRGTHLNEFILLVVFLCCVIISAFSYGHHCYNEEIVILSFLLIPG